MFNAGLKEYIYIYMHKQSPQKYRSTYSKLLQDYRSTRLWQQGFLAERVTQVQRKERFHSTQAKWAVGRNGAGPFPSLITLPPPRSKSTTPSSSNVWASSDLPFIKSSKI